MAAYYLTQKSPTPEFGLIGLKRPRRRCHHADDHAPIRQYWRLTILRAGTPHKTNETATRAREVTTLNMHGLLLLLGLNTIPP